ncbi:MAG: sugar ABC transporter substrate-binding protein [Armatimonadetes bacterium]|nr:sugar ABC transporter substrate-binding protein [Candidatus Hippobium faecium]
MDPNPIRNETIAEYRKTHPNIKITVDPNPGVDTMLTQIAGNVPPDIITVYTIETLRRFQRLGLLEDLTPYVKKYNIPIDSLRPEVLPYIHVKEDDPRVFGITENAGPLCMYYNKDVFDRFGVPYPTNDMTFDEVREIAKKLTSYKKVGGREMVDTKGLYVTEDYEFFIRMFGGSLFSPDGKKCTVNSPQSRKGMEYYADMVLKEKIVPMSGDAESIAPTGGWLGTNLLLAQGKVAMLISGRYLTIQFRPFYSKGARIGMVRCPKSPGKNNLMYTKCYCIPKNSKHKEEAIQFIAHLMSNENQTFLVNYGDAWPAVDNPELDKIAEYNPEYPCEDNNASLMKDFEGSRVKEVSPYINDVDFWAVFNREKDRAMLEEITMAEACANIERDVNKIIRRNIANPNFMN